MEPQFRKSLQITVLRLQLSIWTVGPAYLAGDAGSPDRRRSEFHRRTGNDAGAQVRPKRQVGSSCLGPIWERRRGNGRMSARIARSRAASPRERKSASTRPSPVLEFRPRPILEFASQRTIAFTSLVS